ncbi:MAG TPA: ECF-type sigma factor [Clostridia bacterium]|nr:ECF-type sigma factor [Clostridia bacterium]
MLKDEVKGDVTQVLQATCEGGHSSEKLLPLVYQELRHLAAARMAGQYVGQTLQATALVHEAWLKLFAANRVWQNRTHFFRAAAQAMRQILVDRARRKLSLKQGARLECVTIDGLEVAEEKAEERVLLIDEALERLQRSNAELAQVVTLKFFGGLTNAEVAETTGVTERTVQNKWNFAKAWLLKNIEEEFNPSP